MVAFVYPAGAVAFYLLIRLAGIHVRHSGAAAFAAFATRQAVFHQGVSTTARVLADIQGVVEGAAECAEKRFAIGNFAGEKSPVDIIGAGEIRAPGHHHDDGAGHQHGVTVTQTHSRAAQVGDDIAHMIRDLYDSSIVAYKTETRQTVKLVTDTIRMAKRKEKATAELRLHSDQGFQYTSSAYFGITQAYGSLPSMSRRGNPYDNAVAENFFSFLKCECIYRRKPQTRNQAKKMIDEFIWFCNHIRLQTDTGMTPLEMRALAAS